MIVWIANEQINAQPWWSLAFCLLRSTLGIKVKCTIDVERFISNDQEAIEKKIIIKIATQIGLVLKYI